MPGLDIVIPAKDPGASFAESIDRWLSQKLPQDWEVHLFLVNDGSNSFDFDELVRRHGARLTLITHTHSRGRAAARNSGIWAGKGSYVAFFDADCFPAHAKVLNNFVNMLDAGADVVYGALTSLDNGFWGKYFRSVCKRREERFAQGDPFALTTACCVMRRELLERVGGFDESYRHYGFEDRDLIIRVMEHAPAVNFSRSSEVVHCEDLCLEGICRKQSEAGRTTSGLFRHRHPEYYARMSYARADFRRGSLLNSIAWLFPLLQPGLLAIGRVIVQSNYVPYALKSFWVKLLTGVFYFEGTRQSVRKSQ